MPAWSDFAKAVGTDGWTKPVQASGRLWLDLERAVAVMRTEQRVDGRTTWRLSLIRLTRSEQSWAQAGVTTLQTWAEHDALNRDGSVSVYLEVGDLKQDRELQILARFKLIYMCCGGGETSLRKLLVYNDDAELSPAAYLQLDAQNYHSTVAGKERFVDKNADGHADLVVAQTLTFEDTTSQNEIVHLWEPAANRFADTIRPIDCHCE